MAGDSEHRIVPLALDEAKRRAGILRRYVAIEAPSLEDDDRFAEELGLARHTLYQLARSWRHHANPALLSGAFTRTASGDRMLALEAAANPDLTAVNPTRRRVIGERIAELRHFLSIEEPTRDDELRSAERLGLALPAFRRLHRSWTLARDPAALPGGSTPARIPRRHHPAIDAEVETIIAEVAGELGPDASALEVHRTVVEHCERAGLRAPTKVSVHYRFVEARAKMARPAPDPAIAIDHIALQLPTEGPGGVQFPVLSVAIELSTGHFVAHDLSLIAPNSAATARILAEAAIRCRTGASDIVPLDLASPKEAGWDALQKTLKSNGVNVAKTRTRALRPGRHLLRLLGDRLGRFPLRPGLTTRPETARLRKMGGGSAPLSLPDARAVVEELVSAHNAKRPMNTPRSFVRASETGTLVDALRSSDSYASP